MTWLEEYVQSIAEHGYKITCERMATEVGRLNDALDAYRMKPGGGPACIICGHRFGRHQNSTACLRAALLSISDALKQIDAGPIGPDGAVHNQQDESQS